MLLDGVRMDAVLRFRQRPSDVPFKLACLYFLFFEALELLDKILLELWAEP
jgi:hypothetical protein